MTVYGEDIQAAKESIREGGEVVRWEQYETDETSQVPEYIAKPVTLVTHRPVILFLPIKRVRNASVGFAGGSDRQVGAVKGLMASTDFAPMKTATVYRADGTPLRIVEWDVLAPDGVPILYTIEFKE